MPEPNLRPCPICGNTAFYITGEEYFNDMQSKVGSAPLGISCSMCGLDLWERTYTEHNYQKRLNLAVKNGIGGLTTMFKHTILTAAALSILLLVVSKW